MSESRIQTVADVIRHDQQCSAVVIVMIDEGGVPATVLASVAPGQEHRPAGNAADAIATEVRRRRWRAEAKRVLAEHGLNLRIFEEKRLVAGEEDI